MDALFSRTQQSVLALLRLAERPGPSRAFALALSWAMQVFVADPQTLFYEVLVVAPLLLWQATAPVTARLGANAEINSMAPSASTGTAGQ